MAKLSARGRTEVARFTDGIVELALMSDGVILKKIVGFQGYTVHAKLKKGANPSRWVELMGKQSGWRSKNGRNGVQKSHR